MRYVSVSIPEPLIEKIDEVINKENSSYSSRVEFIKEAIREALRKTSI